MRKMERIFWRVLGLIVAVAAIFTAVLLGSKHIGQQ